MRHKRGTSPGEGCGTTRTHVLPIHAKMAKSPFAIPKLQVLCSKGQCTGVKEGLILQNTSLRKPF